MDGLTLRLSAVDNLPYVLNLEPEGMEHSLAGGTEVLLSLPPGSENVEVVWRPEGVLIFRDVQVTDYPRVRTTAGEALDW